MYDGDQVIDEHCISHTCNCSGRKAFGLRETVYWGCAIGSNMTKPNCSFDRRKCLEIKTGECQSKYVLRKNRKIQCPNVQCWMTG